MHVALLLAIFSQAVDTTVPEDCPNVQLRGKLQNSRAVFTLAEKGHVAFIGGSITEMNGYRPMVAAGLQKRFPKTAFKFTDAGISSTTSTTGAFRFAEQVLAKGNVDLLFLEFAVNDDQDGHHTRVECIRGVEGILRQLWTRNPNADVVVTYFVNEGMLETFKAGRTPLSSGAHDEVAKLYQVPTVELNREVFQRIDAGKLTWKQFGGVHPGPDGNRLCATMIDRLLDRAWTGRVIGEVQPRRLPAPLEAACYEKARFLAFADATIERGWTVQTPDWKSLKGECRGRFKQDALLCATEPGATLTLPFNGRGVGLYLLAGPDAGTLEFSIDGAAPRKLDLYHAFSAGLHYPYTKVLDGDLAPGDHVLKLTLSAERNEKSIGTAARILKLCAN